MSALSRVVASFAAVAAPLASLAQEAGGRDPARSWAGYSWLWIMVGALAFVALFRLLVSRNRTGGPTPPARHP